MHRAKVFVTVCAGIFLLALSYHLGARNATAQIGGSVVEGAAIHTNGGSLHYTGVVDRMFCIDGIPNAFAPPIPGTERVLATHPSYYVMLESGTILNLQGSPTASWVTVGHLCPAATPALSETWGRVKARYR